MGTDMDSIKLNIILDNPQPVYYPSQTVCGSVNIEVLGTPKKIKSLLLIWKGNAHTCFDKFRGECKSRREPRWLVAREGHEHYFRIVNDLIGGKGSSVQLALGHHFYPFKYVLPANIPSSFENRRGFVRYRIKVILTRSWKSNQLAKRLITVVRPLDLNRFPSLREPITLTMNKYFGFLCYKSGPVNILVSLPYVGYIPGEKILVRCIVDNGSNLNIISIKFLLVQLMLFHSTSPWRESWRKRKCVATTAHEGAIFARHNEEFEDYLVIPPLAPSYLQGCSIIDVSYQLEVKVKLNSFCADLTSYVPITIGTCPLTLDEKTLSPSERFTSVEVEAIEHKSMEQNQPTTSHL